MILFSPFSLNLHPKLEKDKSLLSHLEQGEGATTKRRKKKKRQKKKKKKRKRRRKKKKKKRKKSEGSIAGDRVGRTKLVKELCPRCFFWPFFLLRMFLPSFLSFRLRCSEMGDRSGIPEIKVDSEGKGGRKTERKERV